MERRTKPLNSIPERQVQADPGFVDPGFVLKKDIYKTIHA
jgi:hypothetical protein